MKSINFLLVFICLFFFQIGETTTIGESTGYQIPRFVSLKSNESNLRVGPKKDYPIILTYYTYNFPLEIIEEYKQWRKIRDIDGNIGWMFENLFKGNRYGIILTNHSEPAHIYDIPKGKLIWKIGNRNIVEIKTCLKSWCKIKYEKNVGWINKINMWGVYKDEKFNIPFYQVIIDFYWKIKLFIKNKFI